MAIQFSACARFGGFTLVPVSPHRVDTGMPHMPMHADGGWPECSQGIVFIRVPVKAMNCALSCARDFPQHPFMPQSLANILVHLVFSTKDRTRWIADDWRDDLHGYIGGIIRRHDGDLLAAGSVEDHIHLLFPLPRTVSVSDLVREIKSGSTRWVHESTTRPSAFRWQSGYGAFSISPGHKAALCRYIAAQREHHAKVTFQDEFRALLEKYGVDHDERYVWD